MTVGSGNEEQTVTISGSPGGGTYTLTFDGEETGGIAPGATAAAVKTALIAGDKLDTADVTVTGNAGGPYTITFAGAYADANVPVLVADASGLTGGTNPAVTATTTTEGRDPVSEICYADISEGTIVKNEQYLVGQHPAAGKTLVDMSDYYGGGGP